MPTYQPQYTDGKSVISSLSATNLNNGVTYTVSDYKGGEGAQVSKQYDTDGLPTGSLTKVDFREVTLNLSYTLESDELSGSGKEIRPGHVMSFRGRYLIVGKVDPTGKKGETTTVSLATLEAQNPVFSTMLCSDGNFIKATKTAGSAYNATFAVVNTRTGSTVTYSLSGQPSGMTINATSGAISWPTPVAGTYTVKVIATDTLSGQPDRAQEGNLILTVS